MLNMICRPTVFTSRANIYRHWFGTLPALAELNYGLINWQFSILFVREGSQTKDDSKFACQSQKRPAKVLPPLKLLGFRSTRGTCFTYLNIFSLPCRKLTARANSRCVHYYAHCSRPKCRDNSYSHTLTIGRCICCFLLLDIVAIGHKSSE